MFKTPADAQANSLFHLLTNRRPEQAPYIHLDCGIGDDFYVDNRLLVNTLRTGHFRYSYVELEGQHEVPYWENALAISMLLLLKKLRMPARSTEPKP